MASITGHVLAILDYFRVSKAQVISWLGQLKANKSLRLGSTYSTADNKSEEKLQNGKQCSWKSHKIVT